MTSWPSIGAAWPRRSCPADELDARSLMPPGSAAGSRLQQPRARRCPSSWPMPAPAAWPASTSAPTRRCTPSPSRSRSWPTRRRPSSAARAPMPRPPTSSRASPTPRSTDGRRPRRGLEPAKFGLFVDPTKCKGCAECVAVCPAAALRMVQQGRRCRQRALDGRAAPRRELDFFRSLPPTPEAYRSRQGARRPHAWRARLRLRRRRGFVCRLRRGDRHPHDGRRNAPGARSRFDGHRRRHRLQLRLRRDLSVQPVPRAVDELAVRERAGRRHGHPRALGPGWASRAKALGARRRRRDVRHRLPVALSHGRVRRGHQGPRARHAGLLEHRRPGVDGDVRRPGHQADRLRQSTARQARAAQGARPDPHEPRRGVRGPGQHRARQPLLPCGHGRQRVPRPGRADRLHALHAGARHRR